MKRLVLFLLGLCAPGRRLREKLTADWWLCKYETDTQVGTVCHQEGSFAALGKTREEAEKDALATIEKEVIGTVDVKYILRRPTLLERLFGE